MSGLADTIASSQNAPVTVHYQHSPPRASPPINANSTTNMTQVEMHNANGEAMSTAPVPSPQENLPPLVPISMGEGPVTAGALFDKTLWERLPASEKQQLTSSFEQSVRNPKPKPSHNFRLNQNS